MSLRRRAFVRNLAAIPREVASRRLRIALNREQALDVGGTIIALPPDSRLPFYQWRDPHYDTYAAELLRRACANLESATLIDIGANVGDTAVLALTATPNLKVVSVEGSAYFVDYLHRNTEAFGDRAVAIEGFVGPISDNITYTRDGGTGGFQKPQPGAAVTSQKVDTNAWVSVADLLGHADSNLTIWKTDTDGFDIHLVAQNWDSIAEACEVIWMEYDPVGTLGDRTEIDHLIELIAASGRVIHVYDNVGHHMVSGTGDAAARMLRDLTEWLRQRRQGFAPVLYFDLWISTPELDQRLWPYPPARQSAR